MDEPKDKDCCIDIDVDFTESDPKRILAKRLDAIGFGLFLIMIGGLQIVPSGTIPENTWIAGVGIIILGVCAFRSLFGLRVIGFSLFLGILALAYGLSEIYALKLPIFPIILVVAGISIIFGLFKHK